MDTDYQQMRQELLQRNSKFAKPDWKITTFKTDQEEQDFRNWISKQAENEKKLNPKGKSGMFQNYNPEDPYPDYDMRGFYKDFLAGKKTATSSVSSDGALHGSDYYKTPYHHSFSNESQWATKDAPKWIGSDTTGWNLTGPDGMVYINDPPKNSSQKTTK